MGRDDPLRALLGLRRAPLPLSVGVLRERTAAIGPGEALREARAILEDADRVLVLTGAGISADSGVPTFRGEDGLWKRHRPEELATPSAFARDPRLVWEWYAWRREKVAACEPNAAHRALAHWAARRKGVRIVTQNVDALHVVAADEVAACATGSAPAADEAAEGRRETADPQDDAAPEVPGEAEGGGTSGGVTRRRAHPLELHGSLFRVRCTGCGERRPHREPIDASSRASLPRCPSCGALLRPDVVWFGEALPREVLEEAFAAAAGAEVGLVIGTSAVVQPAASLATAVRSSGGVLVEVNPEETPLTPLAAVSLRARAAEAVPTLLGPHDPDGPEDPGA